MTELRIIPSATAEYPLSMDLTANNVRLYFNNFSETSDTGPSKTLFFTDATAQIVFIGIFPDRAGGDENYTLTLTQTENSVVVSALDVDIFVQDFDVPQRTLDFDITMDYRRDAVGTEYFTSSQVARDVAQLAADDWAYFIADMNLDVVPVNEEVTFTWDPPNGFHSGTGVFYKNETAFTGFLMQVYGIDCILGTDCDENDPSNPVRSGGISANDPNLVQSSNDNNLDPYLFRSGLIDFEIKGDFDLNGWFFTSSDDDWQSFNMAFGGENDAYSILHHEMGHTLAFNLLYPAFERGGTITSSNIEAYYGSEIDISFFDHFEGVIDLASLYGIFGNEYNSLVPSRRWLVTKLDVLLMEAVGYQIRPTSAFIDLDITTANLPQAKVSLPYDTEINAVSNTPIFSFGISGMPIPANGQYDLGNGLQMDGFTGEIAGIPLNTMSIEFVLEVSDTSRFKRQF